MKINGEKLKRERTIKGISQDVLAGGIGISQGMVSMLEKGVRNIRWDVLNKICKFVGCEPEQITENGEPSPLTQINRNLSRLPSRQIEIVADLVMEFLKSDKRPEEPEQIPYYEI